ncbi:MAG: DNA alkylation repair protein [Bryobacteraceae bacterium]
MPSDKALAARVQSILDELAAKGDPVNVEGMARFGIVAKKVFGVGMTALRPIARREGRDPELAAALWDSGWHESRVLACFVADPKRFTATEAERWMREFDNWAVCDAACFHLFDKTPWAYAKARVWSRRKREFERRAGFALMASLAVHDKKAGDEAFLPFLEDIERAADDERNFVKKAVNWALRQIGKRNSKLREKAVESAERIRAMDSKAARWIASDALREFQKVAARFHPR